MIKMSQGKLKCSYKDVKNGRHHLNFEAKNLEKHFQCGSKNHRLYEFLI